jgi:hypothetical protein
MAKAVKKAEEQKSFKTRIEDLFRGRAISKLARRYMKTAATQPDKHPHLRSVLMSLEDVQSA